MSEASQTHDAKKWQDAIDIELKWLQRFKAYEAVKISTEYRVVSTRLVFTKNFSEKTNSERYKARLVVRGFEFKTNICDTFAPTPHMDALC